MRRIFTFLVLITFIFSCDNKEDKYEYLPFITAGQVDGPGINYMDMVPDRELIKEHGYGDTIMKLDLNNDGIDDFLLTHYFFSTMQSQNYESLKITALGENTVCTFTPENKLACPLKYRDTINANNSWADSTVILYSVPGYWTMSTGWNYYITGYWFNNDSIYIGVSIMKDNKQLFGWIDMKKNILRQYAVTGPYLE
jgi:hypothetical protein